MHWSFQKNAHEEILVEITEFNGTPVLNLRSWFLSDADEWRPSRKGLTLSLRHLTALATCIGQAEAAARREDPVEQREDAA